MKASLRQWASLAGVVAGCHLALPAMANTCTFDQPGSGPMNLQADLGNVYVPRDARVGSIIGVIDKFVFANNSNAQAITCNNDGTVTHLFNAIPTAPSDRRFHDPIGGEDSNGKIFMTNISGVGARIKLGLGFDGNANNSFVPVDGRPVVPFDATLSASLASPFVLARLQSRVTLVKTGPIEPGMHSLNRQMFDGKFSDIGIGFHYGLSGTVVQSQCEVGANPVSEDPVPLGDNWNTTDFTHPGFTTDAKRFSITLTNCESDPAPSGNQATAFIRLDGANGSIVEGDGSIGVFNLGTGSTAEGMGIQILHGDGVTPVPLGTDVAFGTIENGVNKRLDFNARFYQIKDSSEIRPGLAKGSLNFTLSYQ